MLAVKYAESRRAQNISLILIASQYGPLPGPSGERAESALIKLYQQVIDGLPCCGQGLHRRPVADESLRSGPPENC